MAHKKYDVKLEIELIKLGFKRKWFVDKSGYWFEKSFKKGDFKLRFTIETDNKIFGLDCLVYQYSNKKLTSPQYEAIKLYPCTLSSVKKVLKQYGK